MNSKDSTELKCGFTTGTCAQAAAKGASLMLTTRKLIKKVGVETPSGKKLILRLIDQRIEKDLARCGVVKNAGDDPDVTNGVKIYAEVKFSPKEGVIVIGGEGVGRVTKPGLAVGVGEYAINPVPRKMIVKEVSRYLPKDRGLEVVISVPHGEELAKHTFNPRLGIVGGISIIGTTGIVEPKSTDAYKASLSLQLDVLKASGHKKAVLVLGYVGEKFTKEVLKLNGDSIIKIGDHVGFMLKECVRKKIKEVFLIGHIGKLVKIAKGQFNTHSKHGDNRIETIAHYAKTYGAKRKVLEELLEQPTAEATLDILRKNRLIGVFEKIAQQIVITINEFLDKQLCINCVLLSLKGEILASYPKMNTNINKVYIIGIGPGTEDYLLPIAKREIERADCLIGAKRLLSLFAELNKEKIPLEAHFNDVIPYVKENRYKKKIAVLVSGDPGLYSFLVQLSKVLSKEEYVVIPGISAVQIAFAKIGESWQDARIISLHGREFGNLAKKVETYAKIFLFTDTSFPPEKIAEYLLEKGIENRRVIVFENISYSNERVVDTNLKNLSKMKGFGLCVMIIKK